MGWIAAGRAFFRAVLVGAVLALAGGAGAAPLTGAQAAALVMPPYQLGPPADKPGVWVLLNGGGKPAGWAFETAPLAPLPGFSGAPIDLFVMLDREGRFIDVRLVSQNEPIFVSGLGEAPFLKFLEQYRGLSINQPMTIGSPYGAIAAGSGLVELDGVTKATASVHIAHETLMAATLQVARETMRGLAAGPPARPDPDHDEALDWPALVAQGLVGHLRVTNAEVDRAFAGGRWAGDDPEGAADPEGAYLDLWAVDLGPPAIARAVLDDEGLAALARMQARAPEEEPILLIETARHGLVGPDFVRNTTPDRLKLRQDGLPIGLMDADLGVGLRPGLPEGAVMVLRVDRRLGFDPSRDWQLTVDAVRLHGQFQPEPASRPFVLTHHTDPRFFRRESVAAAAPPWAEALRNRAPDLAALAVLLVVLGALLLPGGRWLAGRRRFPAIRRAVLAVVVVFVGFWGQGQLSVVTVLGVVRGLVQGQSLSFLLYDPFSLMVWALAILGFVAVGRGLFCGWLCPFGALQELLFDLARRLRLPVWEPGAVWDRRLKAGKYLVLAGLVAVAFVAPERAETAAEVEPFKTAITTIFRREWGFVAYALICLGAGLFTFKGYCRYVCPLGAVMAIGGALRLRRWIPRRVDCGSPCQLCRARCAYKAIKPGGQIIYSECFQCLDCVKVHDDPGLCVPLVLAARGRGRFGKTGAA